VWRYTYVNQRAADILGRSAESLLGQYLWDLFPEGAGQPFYEACGDAKARQTHVAAELYYDEQERWLESRIYPSTDGLSILFQDVTERRQAVDALRQQREVLQAVATAEPIATTLAILTRSFEALVPGALCSILVTDATGQRLHLGAAPSLPDAYNVAIDGTHIGPDVGSCGTAAHRQETVIVADIATDPLWSRFRHLALAHGLRACWSSPVLAGNGTVLGTFAVYRREARLPSERERRLIDDAGALAKIAILHQRNEDERERLVAELDAERSRLAARLEERLVES
jgi:PAS domain S-box-containing protein